MKLTDLNPQWVGVGGEGVTDANGNLVPERRGVALIFDCPCGCGTYDSGQGCCVHLMNPLDGGPPLEGVPMRALWMREGERFEVLTLSPSVLRKDKGGCGWHGWIRNGEVTTC